MSNHGLFEISNLEEAGQAWDIFFGRFYDPKPANQIIPKFDPKQTQFIPSKVIKPERQRYSWNEQTLDNGDPKIFHLDDFNDFLNGNTVKIPFELNELDLNLAKEVIIQGDYDDKRAKNKNFIFYALWLFKLGKIKRQQLSTILARDQFSKKYPIVKTFLILNEQGEFTEDAKQMLIPILKPEGFTKFDDWHLQRFRLLIQAADKSEQIFYITECDPHTVSVEGPEQLGNSLLRMGAWERTTYQGGLYDLHLSFGAIEARQIALKGVHGAAASRCKLGKITTRTIKEGVISNYRPTAIHINESGIEPPTKGIHGYPISRMPAVTQHDIYHARLHNEIPSEFHLAFNHMKEIIFNFTQVALSSIQWILTDREFPSFRKENITLDNNPIKATKYFTAMLAETSQLLNEPFLFFKDHRYSQLSEDGIAIIRDMVNQSDKWKKLYKIDINFLGDPYANMIKNMQAFIKIEDQAAVDAKLFSLKYRIYCDLPQKTYQKASQLIDSFSSILINDLKFENESRNHSELKTRTVLKCNNVALTSGNSALQEVIFSYFKAKFTLNQEQVHSEFIELEAEFKSIYAGSQLTEDKLDVACNKLVSLADKLMLLELCYQKILKTAYARRHELIDHCLLSFFPTIRNPLTLSQRIHIGLLKAKMDNLLKEQLLKISDKQDKEQFNWMIENYFKLIHHQDWRVKFMSVEHKVNAKDAGITASLNF